MKNKLYHLVGMLSFLLLSPIVNAQFDIDWANTTNCSVSGNTISRSSSFSGTHDAYGESSNYLADCEDGWIEADISSLMAFNQPPTYLDERKSFGFVPGSISSGFNPFYGVQYGLYILADTPTPTNYILQVIENGTPRYVNPSLTNGSMGSYLVVSPNKKIRIERVGNQVKYYYDGDLIHFYNGSSNVTSSTVTISSNWKAGATFFQQNSEWADAQASFSSKDACYAERDWQGANTGSMYHTFLSDQIGIGIKTPTNKLDVNGDLRIRTVTQNDLLTRMLVTNTDGVVHYRDASSLVSGGSGTSGFIPRWTSSTTLGNSLLQDDLVTLYSGNPGSVSAGSILHLYGSNYSPSSNNKNIGVRVDLLNNSFSATSTAFVANVQNDNDNRGIDIAAANGSRTYGGVFSAQNGSVDNIGGYFYARGLNTSARAIGLYTEVGTGNASSYAGVFTGTTSSNAAYFNGTITTTSVTTISDMKFKRNIKSVTNAMDIISALSATTYNFASRDEFPSMRFPEGLQYGFIAQQVEKVIPEIIEERVSPDLLNADGSIKAKGVDFKGINYIALIPVLTSGIQEQQVVIDEQEKRIDQLQKDLEALKEALLEMNKNSNAEASQSNVLTTQQLSIFPNPTSQGETFVEYAIAESYAQAKLVIYNASGEKVDEIVIGEAKGKLSITTSTYSSGTYFCNLLIDDQLKEVKKFIVLK